MGGFPKHDDSWWLTAPVEEICKAPLSGVKLKKRRVCTFPGCQKKVWRDSTTGRCDKHVYAGIRLSQKERSKTLALLREGYGAEDAAVLLGIELEDVRLWLGKLRARKVLRNLLGTDRVRNAEALKIMGVA